MKKISRYLFALSSIAILLTGCGSNAKTLEPSFKNYTNDDLRNKEDFDAQISAKDYDLSFKSIDYKKTSYEIESSETITTQNIYQYEKGTVTEKHSNRYNTAKLYNHHNNVIIYDTSNTIKNEAPGLSDNLSLEENFAFQMNDKDVVIADKNNKLYEIITTLGEEQDFSDYVTSDHAISNTYLAEAVSYHNSLFAPFAVEGETLKYYSKKNLFTIGISYKEKDIPEANGYYKETLTVGAVCQITVNKNNVAINVRYETTDIKTDFSNEYILNNHVDYSKVTTNKTLLKVINLTVNGTMLADVVDLSNYSLGNVNY